VEHLTQDAGLRLLADILPLLEARSVVDVGAGTGAFARAMLRSGAEPIHLFETESRNLELLHERFRDRPPVTIHNCAVGSEDLEGDLAAATAVRAERPGAKASMLEPSGAPEMKPCHTARVTARSLSSLLESGEIPRRIGILKIDTEGHARAVISGIGDLDCDVVVVGRSPGERGGPLRPTVEHTGDALRRLASWLRPLRLRRPLG
jgi:FkbM family methyltransferase